jgi:hypothetical protein
VSGFNPDREPPQDISLAFKLALDGLRKAPKPSDVLNAMLLFGGMHGLVLPADPVHAAVLAVARAGPNDPMLHALILAIQAWDHADGEAWAAGTLPHSTSRRALVLQRLGFTADQQAVIDRHVPRFSADARAIVIAEQHAPWYEERRCRIDDFYWEHYVQQLLPPRGSWSPEAVSLLSTSIDDVVGRLSDPTREAVYPVKGLVVGYVQSGKTSHFSGLITKAADAGYRFFIVLAGTLDILRQQTQRRIDKEIVGRELLGPTEYGQDHDWARFVSHGGRPSLLGAFDWERLTDRDEDYQSLSRRLSLLEFSSADRSQRFNHPDNLRQAPAKIAVVKKIPQRLHQLCADLEQLHELRSRLEHVPTLIIDDESDQASVNTKAATSTELTATNAAIRRLLGLLPRAQYVGYTATPFANVFIDPEDAEDLFPKDFIISLPRPVGYMGVADFFDFDDVRDDAPFSSNQAAFVRPVTGENEADDNLPKAIDSFVLAGAIKAYRESVQPDIYRFRHHTMLVHHAARRTVHEEDRRTVEEVFRRGARYQTSSGVDALKKLFEEDFVLVTQERAPTAPLPASFDELRPYVSECLSRLCHDQPVRVVNGDGSNRDETPDFEQGSVWSILVGGTKLSRGYTVEGLTTSYYRRPSGAGDTLMQMGRWFGFRAGYQDLVRLFIGRSERAGRRQIDLYEAFRAVCMDEEALRRDLQKYSSEGMRPEQVPPLVHQHMPQLPPTSRNKMFNATIQEIGFAGEWKEPTAAPVDGADAGKNLEAAAGLLKRTALGGTEQIRLRLEKGKERQFSGRLGLAQGAAMFEFLSNYRWSSGRQVNELELRYIQRCMTLGSFQQWCVLLPELQAERETVHSEIPPVSVIRRALVGDHRFGVFSDPGHREAAAILAAVTNGTDVSQNLLRPEIRGAPVLVLYFVRPYDAAAKSDVAVGFGIQYPGQRAANQIVWTVRNRARARDPVVARPD